MLGKLPEAVVDKRIYEYRRRLLVRSSQGYPTHQDKRGDLLALFLSAVSVKVEIAFVECWERLVEQVQLILFLFLLRCRIACGFWL